MNSDYWISAVDEALAAEGVYATDEQVRLVAKWMMSAASVVADYDAPVERSSPQPAREPNKQTAWWEDTSKLSGSDWVLARRIQDLIASRYS